MFVVVEQDQEPHILGQLDPAAPVVVHRDRHTLSPHWSLLVDGKNILPFPFHHNSVQWEGDGDVTRATRGRGDGELVEVGPGAVFYAVLGGSSHQVAIDNDPLRRKGTPIKG